jgi:hypothetical protein
MEGKLTNAMNALRLSGILRMEKQKLSQRLPQASQNPQNVAKASQNPQDVAKASQSPKASQGPKGVAKFRSSSVPRLDIYMTASFTSIHIYAVN